MRSPTRLAIRNWKCRRHPIGCGRRSTTRPDKEAQMYKTTYHLAASVDEAAALFAKGSDAKYLAGGHTLIPVMKQRLASPSDVIDVGRIKDLVGIDVSGDTVTIKAATTHYDVAASSAVQKAIPALSHLAS